MNQLFSNLQQDSFKTNYGNYGICKTIALAWNQG